MVSVTSESHSLPRSPTTNRISPWVTVICISYNHQAYIGQALQSIIVQTYPYVELIVIDNASTDRSAKSISDFIQQHPAIRFIRNSTNLGLNRAFNQGLALAGGQYIIDLSADDVFLPERIAKQVALFEQLPDSCGVVFSNAAYIDAKGQQTGFHYAIDAYGHTRVAVPTGNVFRQILTAYFICTPTMMMRRAVLDELGGYDETLSYEDFDFWVRSARIYQYAYIDEVLTLKRQLPNSLSTQIMLPNNSLLPSTLIVCQKAFDCCTTSDEFQALATRLRTFIRKAFYTEQFDLAQQFGNLHQKITYPDLRTSLILSLCRLHIPINPLYRQYLQYRAKPV